MSELNFNANQHRAILDSELEQRRSEIGQILHARGEDWTDRLDQLIRGFEEHDADPWRTVGKLAQIGFLHWCREANEVYLTQDPEILSG